jgi:photosystem II stability/assembly factor-like uncharacterized protein
VESQTSVITNLRKALTVTTLCCSLFPGPIAGSQLPPNAGWHLSATPFRVIGIASDGSSIWACGANEEIAVSRDAGIQWQLKHKVPDGNLLLNIQFIDRKFGFAAGTGGLLLVTEDGGETWIPHSGPSATILQASFSDPQHGLIRTPEALEFTADGGKRWTPITAVNNPDALKTFPYTFSLHVLDSNHMAVMLKQGAAQYEPQMFLTTSNAGKSWETNSIPNVTLYSFLSVRGKYWAVGTEVVDKDKPDGGHAVPVALVSADGIQWTHSPNDLSACKPEGCIACTAQGCFSSNGTVTDFFGSRTIYRTFPTEPTLTTKWAATDSAICFVGNTVACTALTISEKPTTGEQPEPVTIAPPPLDKPVAAGPHCVECELDRILIDTKAKGIFTVKLSLDIAEDGTVGGVKVDGAPTPQIKSRIEQQAEQWIFEPYMKNGIRVRLKLNTQIQIDVVHPQ